MDKNINNTISKAKKYFFKDNNWLVIFIFTSIFSVSQIPTFNNYINSISLLIITLIVVDILLFVLLSFIFNKLLSLKIKRNFVVRRRKLVFLTIFSLFFTELLIILLLNYPGKISVDSYRVYLMVTGGDFQTNWFRYDTFNNQHPVLYSFFVFILDIIIKFFTTDFNTETFIMCLIQITVMAFSFAWCCNKILIITKNKLIYLLTIVLLFITIPFIWYYTYIFLKDSIFSSVALILITELLEISIIRNDYFKNTKKVIWFVFISLLICLLRNNGFFIVACSLIALLILLKEKRKLLVVVSTIMLSIFLVFNISTSYILNVTQAHFSESLAVPLHQIAWTVGNNGNMSEDEKDYINSLLPLNDWEGILENNMNTDIVKLYSMVEEIKFNSNFNDELLDNNKIEFLKKYTTIGFKNFSSYFSSWVSWTKRLWSLFSEMNRHIATNIKIPFFDPSTNEAIMSLINNIYSSLYICGIGWFAVTSFIYNKWRKETILALPCVPLIIYWLSYFLSIPAYDTRYFLPLIFGIPIIFTTFFTKEDNNIATQQNIDLSYKHIVKET